MRKDKQKIGIVTFPISTAGVTPLSNFIDVLRPLSDNIYLITGNEGYSFFKKTKEVHVYGITHKEEKQTFNRIISYIWTQLRISYCFAKQSRCADTWIFYIGGESLLLPMITARSLNIKVILALAGFPSESLRGAKDPLFKPLELVGKINLALSNKIIVYSKNIIKERGLEKYRSKILIVHKHFIDFTLFNISKRIEERENVIGYIGRLHKEKGVLNFIEAIPSLQKMVTNIAFLIGGNGELSSEIRAYLKKKNSVNRVEMVGWIPHENLPKYLNKLKLLVLPSYAEGLPNIMLEAMACGTPVLATCVGAIPDVIEDKKNGFLLEDNSPECISKKILEVLARKDLGEISNNARITIKKNFTYNSAVGNYRRILKNI